jgi:hypothetical protein
VVIFPIGVVFSGNIKKQMRCYLSCSLRVRKGGDITLLNLLPFFLLYTLQTCNGVSVFVHFK